MNNYESHPDLEWAVNFATAMYKKQHNDWSRLLKLLSERTACDIDSAFLKSVAQRILTALGNKEEFKLRADEAEQLREFLHANMQDDMVQFLDYSMGDTIEEVLA